jgi:hypothetical protein
MPSIAIMQPYFLPYLGYFHLIRSVDIFVIYDDIKYTKKGWINRNRLLFNGKVEYVTLPLVKDSDFLNIDQRKISPVWYGEKDKFLRKIEQSYRERQNFEQAVLLAEEIFSYDDFNLFSYIRNSLEILCRHLRIETEIITSSSLGDFRDHRGKEKVLEICKALNSREYINMIGGQLLYDKDEFRNWGVDLKFVQSSFASYDQNQARFEPGLSILDMILSIKEECMLAKHLGDYQLV